MKTSICGVLIFIVAGPMAVGGVNDALAQKATGSGAGMSGAEAGPATESSSARRDPHSGITIKPNSGQSPTFSIAEQPAGIGERGSAQTQSTMERSGGQQNQKSENSANPASETMQGITEGVRSETATQGDDAKGVIGISLRLVGERVGDATSLYVAHVHAKGPAKQAGLKHGDEVVTVNGEAVTGKTYEQVIQMVRGEAGTEVKLGVKRKGEVQEIAITRISGDELYKG